jgi:hypothetical protein
MKRAKARRAATYKARDPRRIYQLGSQIDPQATIPDPIVMQAIYVGQQCLGFIYSHGRLGIEAFDSDTRSLGLYADRKAAADAVAKAAGGVA